MNDSPVDCQSRDRPSHGEKPKSTRLFVAVARPNPLCSTKNKNHLFGGFLFLSALGRKNPCAAGAGFDHLPQSDRPCLHEAAARQRELAEGEQSPF